MGTGKAALWEKTQDPRQHVRWDIRFTAIEYLPRTSASEPQRFLYQTRLGLGVQISGYGETVASSAEGTSVLRFGSADPKSLIREGNGCWVYKEQGATVLFRTVYQYDVRYGWFGQVVDRGVFRPLITWATAWSFDRLRLWVEEDVPPEISVRMTVLNLIARLLLAFVWAYHGIVPKWLFPQNGERLMLEQTGLFPGREAAALYILGVVEVLIGLGLLRFGRSRQVLAVVSLVLVVLTGIVMITQPESLTAPMNPLTFNVALLGLVAVLWVTAPYVPSASRCNRKSEGRS